MSDRESTHALKQEAFRLGFGLAGVCPAVTPPGIGHFRQWLAEGMAGQMHYLESRAPAYEHPEHVLEGVRSILMLGMNYRGAEPAETGPGQGRVARYAWGRDYHDVIHEKLHRLADFHRGQDAQARVRGVVDTAPLLEREFAQLAGLGWIGKNTLLLNRSLGSWFFLAALLTTAELEYDPPQATSHCGTCRACLDACPTQALVAPYRLDARKCISYLTIELGGAIPREDRDGMGDWLFGCDICQEVCPWNQHLARIPGRKSSSEAAPTTSASPVELAALVQLDDEAFRRRFRHTPLWRARRRGLLGNAALVLGNRPCPKGIEALARGLRDAEPWVRQASAWALGRHADVRAAAALRQRLDIENDPQVRREIEWSLEFAVR